MIVVVELCCIVCMMVLFSLFVVERTHNCRYFFYLVVVKNESEKSARKHETVFRRCITPMLGDRQAYPLRMGFYLRETNGDAYLSPRTWSLFFWRSPCLLFSSELPYKQYGLNNIIITSIYFEQRNLQFPIKLDTYILIQPSWIHLWCRWVRSMTRTYIFYLVNTLIIIILLLHL